MGMNRRIHKLAQMIDVPRMLHIDVFRCLTPAEDRQLTRVAGRARKVVNNTTVAPQFLKHREIKNHITADRIKHGG